ncbi:MAG: hypothetical protein ABSG03_07355 [Bryobacteraceae bacterium]|jgi:hypothetical protein
MRAHFLTLTLALTVLTVVACSPKEEDPPLRTYPMGERVLMGHLIYTVFERQWMPQIGTGLDARIPQNRFYLLRINVMNNGGADAIVPTMLLVDDAGATFPEIENGEGVPDFIGSLRQLAPAETVQGNLIFDVLPKHYKLKVSDEDGKQASLVDLPLSFEPDAPDVTTPLNTDHNVAPTKK